MSGEKILVTGAHRHDWQSRCPADRRVGLPGARPGAAHLRSQAAGGA